MNGNDSAAFGIFANRANAEAAVDQLTLAGFSSHDISALLSEMGGSEEFATENDTQGPLGATAGAGIGGVVGGAWACWRALAPWPSLMSAH